MRETSTQARRGFVIRAAFLMIAMGVGAAGSRAGAACPPPGANPTSALNVQDFGAVPDDAIDDQPAIQSAIDCAKQTGNRNIWFPPGSYLLRQTLRAEVDNLTLFGSPAAVLVVDPAAAVIDTIPEAILVNQQSNQMLVETKRVTIRDLTFDVRNGTDSSQVSFGVIQLNDCVECVVKNVRMFWGGPQVGGQKPRNVDGIVMSQGSSGWIHGVVVEGIPKAGIYLAQGTHDVTLDDCEVVRSDGPLGRAGISVGATHATIANCRSHDNGEIGLLISTTGPIGNAQPVAPEDIQVLGGEYYHNGSALGVGIMVASAYSAAVPRHVELANVSAHSNVHGPGILISGAEDVTISNPIVHDNEAQGVIVQTPLWNPPSPRRSGRILISEALAYDNGCAITTGVGIHLLSVDLVTIAGGRIYNSPAPSAPSCKQAVAVLLSRNSFGVANDRIRVLDLDTTPDLDAGSLVAVDPLDKKAAAAHGYYRLQGSGPPNALAAPVGSQYTDLKTAHVYRRLAGGWVTP